MVMLHMNNKCGFRELRLWVKVVFVFISFGFSLSVWHLFCSYFSANLFINFRKYGTSKKNEHINSYVISNLWSWFWGLSVVSSGLWWKTHSDPKTIHPLPFVCEDTHLLIWMCFWGTHGHIAKTRQNKTVECSFMTGPPRTEEAFLLCCEHRPNGDWTPLCPSLTSTPPVLLAPSGGFLCRQRGEPPWKLQDGCFARRPIRAVSQSCHLTSYTVNTWEAQEVHKDAVCLCLFVTVSHLIGLNCQQGHCCNCL